MMIRKTMFQLITTDASITGIIPAARWFQRGSVVDTPVTPFAVLAELGTEPVNGRYPWLYGVYVHDRRGSYVVIDQVLRLVRARLESTVQYVGPDGRLVEASYRETSGDSFDDAFGTGFKNSNFRVVGVFT